MSEQKGPRPDAGAAREDESFDVEKVTEWLRGSLPDLRGAPEVTQYSGGASNWTYRLKYPDHDLILRRPPAGTKAKSAHDMGREYRIQSALAPHFPYVPKMIGLCDDEAVIGSDFYVMERLDGLIPRARMAPETRPDATLARQMNEALIARWVDLHAVDFRAAGLDSLYKGPGYVTRQVEGWARRYDAAHTWNVPSYKRVQRWLADNTPDDVGTSVIHNDWRFDNMVFSRQEPAKIIGVLDWELATVGDPLMDLGSALAYWVEANDSRLMRMTRRQPTHLPGMMRREEVVERYLAQSGLKTNNWAFYEVFGLFRLAGIAQQIYYRYHHKQTRNPAFKNFWILINYFDWRCKGIIGRRGRG